MNILYRRLNAVISQINMMLVKNYDKIQTNILERMVILYYSV
jgi:hypothetical protein